MTRSTDPLGDPAARIRIVSVLTCFNRKAMTLACLGALEAAARYAQVDLEAIVVDDASTDGTAAAIRIEYPWVEVIDGPGALFWNRGMYVGFGVALQRSADYYLWLNDDTVLVADALGSLLQQSEQLRRAEDAPVIVVGATAERSNGRVTYGGRVTCSRWLASTTTSSGTRSGRCHVRLSRGTASSFRARWPNTSGISIRPFEHAMGDRSSWLASLVPWSGLFGITPLPLTSPVKALSQRRGPAGLNKWRYGPPASAEWPVAPRLT